MSAKHPVAIGGIGGSGTRVGAVLLHLLGYYLGDDLNEAMDNLWFTLFFKRRSILVETEEDFSSLAFLFCSRMSGSVDLSETARRRLFQLADRDRLQHARYWLLERFSSFCNGSTSAPPDRVWGWKEPNVHVVIDRLLKLNSDLRYIHVVRHPIEMAVSANQNQLQLWGPAFLDRDVEIAPRDSLSYWCAVHRRIIKIEHTWSNRVVIINFEEFCEKPGFACKKIATFLGATTSENVISSFEGSLQRQESYGRYRGVDIGQFERGDVEYVAGLGYSLP